MDGTRPDSFPSVRQRRIDVVEPSSSKAIRHKRYIITKRLYRLYSLRRFPNGIATHEIRSFIRASLSRVHGNFWVRAKRPGSVDGAVRGMRGDDFRGCNALFDPVFQRRQHIEGI